MKRISVFLTAMFILMLTGCQQKLGGYTYSSIYILEGEKIIDAQDYTLTLSAEGEEKKLKVICSDDLAITGKDSWISHNKITVNGITATVNNDAQEYEYTTDRKYRRTLQSITFKAPENTSGKKKIVKMKILSFDMNGIAAKITVIQGK